MSGITNGGSSSVGSVSGGNNQFLIFTPRPDNMLIASSTGPLGFGVVPG
jgi:hypothetical protein